MIIGIPSRLQPVPKKASLPSSVDLKQRLTSDAPPETVFLRFGIARANCVWFDTGSGLTKQLVRQATVDANGDVTQTVRLAKGPGTDTLLVEIDETITDSTGLDTHDVCIVEVQP